jgi:hypothetical protein
MRAFPRILGAWRCNWERASFTIRSRALNANEIAGKSFCLFDPWAWECQRVPQAARKMAQPCCDVTPVLILLVRGCESSGPRESTSSFEKKDIFWRISPTVYIVLIPSKSVMQIGAAIASSSLRSRFTNYCRIFFGNEDKKLGPSLGIGSCRKFYFCRLAVLGILAFVSLLAWSIVTPSPGSRDTSIHRDGAVNSPFEFPSLAVSTPLRNRNEANRRLVYPYSIIPGGVVSATELRSAMAYDAVVAAHYAAFDLAKARVFRLQEARAVYVSYRRGDDVFWTSKKLRLAAGETLITDGQHTSRTRCGNQISDSPRTPISLAADPVPETLDAPLVSQIIEPVVAPIIGDLESGGLPAAFLPFVGAGGGGGGTAGVPVVPFIPIIPTTGGQFPPPDGPPPTPTPEPTTLILLSTGLGAACLFRKLRKT